MSRRLRGGPLVFLLNSVLVLRVRGRDTNRHKSLPVSSLRPAYRGSPRHPCRCAKMDATVEGGPQKRGETRQNATPRDAPEQRTRRYERRARRARPRGTLTGVAAQGTTSVNAVAHKRLRGGRRQCRVAPPDTALLAAPSGDYPRVGHPATVAAPGGAAPSPHEQPEAAHALPCAGAPPPSRQRGHWPDEQPQAQAGPRGANRRSNANGPRGRPPIPPPRRQQASPRKPPASGGDANTQAAVW